MRKEFRENFFEKTRSRRKKRRGGKLSSTCGGLEEGKDWSVEEKQCDWSIVSRQ